MAAKPGQVLALQVAAQQESPLTPGPTEHAEVGHDSLDAIEGGQLHFKLVHDFSGDEGHDFDIYMSTDRGESWMLYFDQHYAPAN